MTHWGVACCLQSTEAYLEPCPDAPGSARTFRATLEQWNSILNNPQEGDVYSVSASGEAPYCVVFTLDDPGGPYDPPLATKFAEVEDCDDPNCGKRIWYFIRCITPSECDETNRNVYVMAAYEETWKSLLPGVGDLDPEIPASYAGTWKFRMGEHSAVECNKCVEEDLEEHCDSWCGYLITFDNSDDAPFCYENDVLGNFPICECCDVDEGEIQFIDDTFPGEFIAKDNCFDPECNEPCAPIKCESNVVKVTWEHIVSCGIDGQGYVNTDFTEFEERTVCGGEDVCQVKTRRSGIYKRKDAWQIKIRFSAYLSHPNAVDQPTDCDNLTERTTLSLIDECIFIEQVEINNFNTWDVNDPDVPTPSGQAVPSIQFYSKEDDYTPLFCQGEDGSGSSSQLNDIYEAVGRFYFDGVEKGVALGNQSEEIFVNITKSRGWTDDVLPDAPCVQDPDDCLWFFNWRYPLRLLGYVDLDIDDIGGPGTNDFLPASHKIGDPDPLGLFKRIDDQGNLGMIQGRSVAYVSDGQLRCCDEHPSSLRTYESGWLDAYPHSFLFGASNISINAYITQVPRTDEDADGNLVWSEGLNGSASRTGSDMSDYVYGVKPVDGYPESRFPYGDGTGAYPYDFAPCYDLSPPGTSDLENSDGPNANCFDNCASTGEIVDQVQIGTGTQYDIDFAKSSPAFCDGGARYEMSKDAAIPFIVKDRIISIEEVDSIPGGC